MSPEEVEINASLNRAFRLIAQLAAEDVMYKDRERIKKQLATLGSFHELDKQGVVPLEDALNVVDNELVPNNPGPKQT